MTKAYLTIDDAPSKDFRKKINYLIKKNIFAIIFCIGQNIKKNKKDVIYAIKKGFVIGNHSYNHPHFSEIELEECLNQIKKTDKIIEDLYKETEIKRPIKIFRFPYGDKGGKNKKNIQEILKSLSYKQPKFENIKYLYYRFYGLHKDWDVFFTFDIISGEGGTAWDETVKNNKKINDFNIKY